MKKILTALVFAAVILSTASLAAQANAKQNASAVPNPPNPPMINVVYGQALGRDSRGSEWPLSSDDWGLYLNLYRIDSYGQASWTAGTDCWWMNQGCADNFGQYQFRSDWQGGALPIGEYMIEASAFGHLVNRVSFRMDGVPVNVKNELPLASVYMQLLSSSRDIDKLGGKIEAQVRVWNFDNKTGSIQASAMVNGPTLTQSYGSYQVALPDVKVPTDLWTYADMTMSVPIAGSLPNGLSYCANFRVGAAGETVSEVWACATKGAQQR